MCSEPVQSELRGIFESAQSSSLDAERPVVQARHHEQARCCVFKLAAASRTDLKLLKGAQTMKRKLWTETLELSRLKVPNSRFALPGLALP